MNSTKEDKKSILNYTPEIIEDDRIKLYYDKNSYDATFPIYNQQIRDMYKKSEALNWVVEEIDFSKDKEQYDKLSDNEKFFVKKILSFFSTVDGIVAKICDINMAEMFGKIKELATLYRFQSRMEDVHNETYSQLIDTMIVDKQEKMNVMNAHMVFDDIKEKVDWIKLHIDPKVNTLPYIVLSQVIVEGVLFSGAFCSIYWFKKSNRLPAFTQSNDFIARDEGLHTETGVMVYNLLKERLEEKEVHILMKEAIDIEKKFITESIPCNLIGMNSKLMCQYIEYIADRLLVQLKYNKIYNSSIPDEFSFMELISMKGKTNFFEKRNVEYQTAIQTTEEKDIDNSFGNDVDF